MAGSPTAASTDGRASVGRSSGAPMATMSIVSQQLRSGSRTSGNPNRTRLHTDDSIEVKYYDNPENFLSKMAFSLDR